jgi:hypothetical protein
MLAGGAEAIINPAYHFVIFASTLALSYLFSHLDQIIRTEVRHFTSRADKQIISTVLFKNDISR